MLDNVGRVGNERAEVGLARAVRRPGRGRGKIHFRTVRLAVIPSSCGMMRKLGSVSELFNPWMARIFVPARSMPDVTVIVTILLRPGECTSVAAEFQARDAGAFSLATCTPLIQATNPSLFCTVSFKLVKALGSATLNGMRMKADVLTLYIWLWTFRLTADDATASSAPL